MSKSKIVLQWVVIIFLILCLSSCNASKNKTPKSESDFPATSIVRTVGNIDVIVDPNVEMMNIIQRLAGMQPSFVKTAEQEPYIAKVEEYFESHKYDSAVKMLKQNMMYYGTPSEFGMYLNQDDSDFIMKIDDKNFVAMNGEAKKIPYFALPDFRDAVRTFRIESKFDDFFLSNTADYEALIEKHVKIISDTKLDSWLKDFYGVKLKEKSCLYVTKLSGNYGISFSTPKGKSIPHAVVIDTPTFYETLHLISHEFSHPMTKDISDQLYKNGAIRKLFDDLYSKNQTVYQANGYRNGQQVLNETITQACACKFDEKVFPSEVTQWYDFWYVDSTKLIYVPAIAEFLDNYQDNRSKYKTLKSFAPELERFILSL